MSEPRNTFVYTAYDASGGVLYVGITRNAAARYRSHAYSSAWFADVVRWRMEGPLTNSYARELERWRILRDSPRFNRNGAPPSRDFDVMRCAYEGRTYGWMTRAEIERVKAGAAA